MGRIVDVWTRAGIRKQLTAVSVLLVAIPLCLGVVVLANLLTSALVNTVVTSATDVAHRTADHVQDYGPSTLPGELQLEDRYRVQVLDATNHVVWASSNRYRTAFNDDPRPGVGRIQVQGAVTWWGPGDNERQDILVSRGTAWHDQRFTVLVQVSQAEQHNAVAVTTGLLLACVPLVLLATGLTAWWVAGRALRPVDQMNSRVGRITSSTLDERVPLPPAHDELHSLAQTMNRMLAGLEQAQTSQQRFVSDASHELRSPLASLSGALEIAQAEDRLDTWREMAPLLGAETQRMNHLVQGLLTLSRRDDAGLTLSLSDTDLDDLAAEEAARVRSTTSLQVETAITACRVHADPALLRQVLVNLVDNATRHARHTVRITVAPQPATTGTPGAGGGALLRVEDDGNGIAPADRERVFDRFVRLQESRSRDEGGSGLGLAIVKQTVDSHGGRVLVTDSDLGGACFEVLLPPPAVDARSRA